VAGNLALTFAARGGVYIAGGIVPHIAEYVARSTFRERFVAKGRFRNYLEAVPTNVIVCSDPAFIGLKWLAMQKIASSTQ
jgi:glucokinase